MEILVGGSALVNETDGLTQTKHMLNLFCIVYDKNVKPILQSNDLDSSFRLFQILFGMP